MQARAVDLNGEAPIAIYDSRDRFVLGIDFSRPPEEIAAALTLMLQDAVDSGRWVRHGTCGDSRHKPAAGAESTDPGPH